MDLAVPLLLVCEFVPTAKTACESRNGGTGQALRAGDHAAGALCVLRICDRLPSALRADLGNCGRHQRSTCSVAMALERS